MAGLMAVPASLAERSTLLDRTLQRRTNPTALIGFFAAVAASLTFIVYHVVSDLDSAPSANASAYLLLISALLIALGFEFVNGFHDTANAVATVIYTHSLQPTSAVVLSGIFNLTGVLLSSGTVAFAVVTLLPVELILQVNSGTGFAMVFALLVAAILWNLGTWWFGLPASSSHTLVGSIIGVGLANQFLNPHLSASGVDWDQVIKVMKALLISPVIGFVFAGVLLLLAKQTLKFPGLYEAPKDMQPPPLPIRALMVLTCTGVSFFHGSNDGQKGMGLIMLILIGTVPTAYALNHGMGPAALHELITASQQVESILDRHATAALPPAADPRAVVMDTIRSHRIHPESLPALRAMVAQLDREVAQYSDLKAIPPQQQAQIRNDMYVIGEALRILDKSSVPALAANERAALKNYRAHLDKVTKFIPSWVKVAVALALGLGTMIGWKRIVITVGEKIGRQRLTYAQGASAGLVAMGTILAADTFGLPVSTTHILSSGVAGTMAANGSGLYLNTVRNILAGWVLTLPAAALLSGILFWIFKNFA
jgi:inorganic phosphate transporter, PiT family